MQDDLFSERKGKESIMKAFLALLLFASIYSPFVAASELNCSDDGEHASSSATYTFATYDVPGSTLTSISNINDAGDVVGTYWYPQQAGQFSFSNAFQLRKGTLTVIQYPGYPDTAEGANGINNRDQIVGNFRVGRGLVEGFLYQNGIFSTISTTVFEVNAANGINDAGTIVGNYFDSKALPSGQSGAYILRNGVFSTINIPGATTVTASGINNEGDIVGVYYDAQAQQHGFLLRHSKVTDIVYPGAQGITPNGINERDIISGTYSAAGTSHGFVLDHGKLHTIDVPGATGTQAGGLNNAGQVVGAYQDASGHTHGFIATPTHCDNADVLKLPF
jgi:hypothetical protein